MKFDFPFEKLLDHKRMVEELAQRDWAQAQAKVDEANAELKRMYIQIDDARARVSKLTMAGGAHAASLADSDVFVNGQKIRIERFRRSIRELQMEAERLHEVLIEAAKERKTLEKLKERRLQEFKAKVKKHELKEMDELVVTRFKR